MATSITIMAADNYYLLPSYDETLRYDELDNFFSVKATTAEVVKCGRRYMSDRSTIIPVEKVSKEPAQLRIR